MKSEHPFRFHYPINRGKEHICDIEVNAVAYTDSDGNYIDTDIDHLKWVVDGRKQSIKNFSYFLEWICPDLFEELKGSALQLGEDRHSKEGRSLARELDEIDRYENQ